MSEWFEMAHDRSQAAANIRLMPDEPAYLEVTVDPAAHGDAGLGWIRRGILLRTAGGQTLQLEVAAEVVHTVGIITD